MKQNVSTKGSGWRLSFPVTGCDIDGAQLPIVNECRIINKDVSIFVTKCARNIKTSRRSVKCQNGMTQWAMS